MQVSKSTGIASMVKTMRCLNWYPLPQTFQLQSQPRAAASITCGGQHARSKGSPSIDTGLHATFETGLVRSKSYKTLSHGVHECLLNLSGSETHAPLRRFELPQENALRSADNTEEAHGPCREEHKVIQAHSWCSKQGVMNYNLTP